MAHAEHVLGKLIQEQRVLIRHCGQAQQRCSLVISAQSAEIIRLREQLMRLRGALIARDTARAWASGIDS